MNRLEVFKGYKNHPWFSRKISQLSLVHLILIEHFINSNNELSKGDFELAVNRMFLDKDKPKKYKEIQELLSCCNSAISS